MSDSEEEKSPRELIEFIRREEYGVDSGASAQERRRVDSLRRKLNTTLKILSEDIYSKQTHFVLELVQNAEDNDYANGVVPSLLLKVSPAELLLVNNELGFRAKNVTALCDVGKSSKAKKQGYIGEKGIGFKSVFTVSDAPEIHSNGYHFKFNIAGGENLLGYVVPDWCSPIQGIPENKTAILLPAKTGCTFGEQTFIDIDAHILLFLTKLRRIELEYQNRKVLFSRVDRDGVSLLESSVTGPEGKAEVSRSGFLRISHSVDMSGLDDDKRPNIPTTDIVIALPLSDSGAAQPEKDAQVFAFLPVRPAGFKFFVNADFVLSSNREDIHSDRPWNQRLRDQIPAAFVSALEKVKGREALAYSYLQFLPNASDIVDPFFKPVVVQLVKLLSESACLPSAGGQWLLPRQLRFGGLPFRELFPSVVSLQLFGFDYVDERVKASEELLRRIGALPVSYKDVLNIFKNHGEWVKAQNIEWKAKLYAYLSNLDQVELRKAGIHAVACIPTTGGDFVSPEKTQVFYPLSRNRRFGFEHELVVIDVELLEQALKISVKVREFFDFLNVKQDVPYDLIKSHILPRHAGEAWKHSDHKALVGHLRYIKARLDLYLSLATAKSESEDKALQSIRDVIKIGTKEIVDGAWLFDSPSNLYVSKEYEPEFCVESMLGKAVQQSKLVSENYLSEKAKDMSAERQSWLIFFRKLGLTEAPKLIGQFDGNYSCSEMLSLLLGSERNAVRKATLECIDRNWDRYSPRLTYFAKSGRGSVVRETSFAISLKSMIAPVRGRVKASLPETYYPSKEIKELFGESPIYLDAKVFREALLDFCSITHLVDATACIKRLRQLKDLGGDTSTQLHLIYRHLERLWSDEGASIEKAFYSEELIRVKRGESIWSLPGEVSWRSNGPFLDSLYPPLQGQYRDFSGFFLNKLGVPKELPTERFVSAIERLTDIESPEERAREALAIYKRASRDLHGKGGSEPADKPDWMQTFLDESVYLTQHDVLVAKGPHLFANDSPEFTALFHDVPEISIFAVPFDELPRVRPLLEAVEIQFLSESIDVKVIDCDGGRLCKELTERIRMLVPLIGRAFYSRHHSRFERSANEGLFEGLRRLEILEVPELKLEVRLLNVSRFMSREIASSGNQIFLRAGARSPNDQIAIEICNLLNAPEDLSDLICRIITLEDERLIRDYFELKQISSLPPDMEVALSRSNEAKVSESGSDLDIVGDGVTEPSGESELPNKADFDGVAPAVESTEQTYIPEAIDLPRVVEQSSEKVVADRGIPNQLEPKSIASQSEPRKLLGIGQENSLKSADDPYSAGYFAKQKSEGEHSSLSKPGKGSKRPSRSGRLLSYADSPGDSRNDNTDVDSAAAKARIEVGKLAVDYFIDTQSTRWKSLKEMPHNNPGFDIKAISHDGLDEYIEIKGQSAAWTAEGVALTPTELDEARRQGDRYWLCIVEYVKDEKRRAVYLVQNPYKLTQQFRFDSGWKSAAINSSKLPQVPEAGLWIEVPDRGKGKIISAKRKGAFFKLHVQFAGEQPRFLSFNPATMKISDQ